MQEQTKGIAGHEGAGEVVKVADDIADTWKVGDRAGVKWVVRIASSRKRASSGSTDSCCRSRFVGPASSAQTARMSSTARSRSTPVSRCPARSSNTL